MGGLGSHRWSCKSLEFLCIDGFLGWTYISKRKTILLEMMDGDTLCNTLPSLYCLCFESEGECMGLLSYITVMKLCQRKHYLLVFSVAAQVKKLFPCENVFFPWMEA